MENEKVLASVNGKQITQGDVENMIASMGQQGQAYRSPQGYEAVLEQLINEQWRTEFRQTVNGELRFAGFYGAYENGVVKTFSRGGSDITGSIVSRAVKADVYPSMGENIDL